MDVNRYMFCDCYWWRVKTLVCCSTNWGRAWYQQAIRAYSSLVTCWSHDTHMMLAWCSHDTIHDTHTILIWCSHDAHMILTWYMMLAWYSHDTWCSHDTHMILTWCSHDTHMMLTWYMMLTRYELTNLVISMFWCLCTLHALLPLLTAWNKGWEKFFPRISQKARSILL